jgi:hypothetical protein
MDPTGLTWCPACGYCPLLETPTVERGRKTPRSLAKLGAVDFFKVVGTTPDWLWRLLFGVVAAVAISLVADFLLIETAHDRAVWGLWQLLAGLGLVLVAHVLALRQVTVVEARSCSGGSWSLTGLWRATLGRLPETRWPVNLVSWGGSLILCSVLIVGGLGWWIENVRFTDEKPTTSQAGEGSHESIFKSH